ncbi:MAG: 4-hydroxy-tetrahydrodipicolinate synthase [Xanthomonadales bacterium]|nr:4-hydroxy-tetrahydrodipicolinate synthase [Xanthomonadales bacterium]
MFSGSIVALVTPMDEQGRIDLPAFDRLLDWHLECGTSGVVVAGTTGESPTVSVDEFEAMVNHAVQRCGGQLSVIAGTGTASTKKSIEMTSLAADLGADGALVVTPYYNRPTQAGLAAHFGAIADASTIPILLYNVPARTGVDLEPETALRLSAHPQVAGIKEARADLERIEALVAGAGEAFVVLSGDDGTACQAMLRGAKGVVSVAANVVPRAFAKLCDFAVTGRRDDALAADRELGELYSLLGIEPNPVPVKWMMHEAGVIGPGIRLPLVPLGKAHHAAARRCLGGLDVR